MKSQLRSLLNSQLGADVLGIMLLIPGVMIFGGLAMTIFAPPEVRLLWMGVTLEGLVILADVLLFLRWLQRDRPGRAGGHNHPARPAQSRRARAGPEKSGHVVPAGDKCTNAIPQPPIIADPTDELFPARRDDYQCSHRGVIGTTSRPGPSRAERTAERGKLREPRKSIAISHRDAAV
jgi:hypothetical protein